MSVGIGPRIPVAEFSENRTLGMGLEVELSYTDISFLPVFFYTKAGFQHFPGKQSFYKISDLSSISTNLYSLSPGVRLYLEPISDKMVLLMPVLEMGLTANYLQTFNYYKTGVNKTNFTERKINFGFHAGIGFSMFMLDVMAQYNHVPSAQYISFDLNLRIPIFATI
ncbi:MAG TPA: hypothetical protein PL041_00400 [Melioribacteraceae bacterium]|nr:hypothetical protein [Melioribacteraceae bacterium]